MNATPMNRPLRARTGAALLVLAASAASCGDPDVFLPEGQSGSPKGVIDGVVTYSGPLPCTQRLSDGEDHILGAALLLAFDTRLLPPPEGLGTTSQNLGVVAGDELFAGVRGRLTFNPDGSRWCPTPDLPPVTVSADFAIAPLDAAVYQIRGFYDRDGNFNPAFKISQLPTRGDVGGGAIDNVSDVLQGKAPIYRNIAIGELKADGTRVIPAQGARIGGVSVTLGLTLPNERPIFFEKDVTYPGAEEPMVVDRPASVTMPSDFQLANFSAFSPAATEKSFIKIRAAAGMPEDELPLATEKPFSLPLSEPKFVFSQQDVNGDGKIDSNDHIPDSDLVPSLYPLSIFSKLKDGAPLVNQGDLMNDPGKPVAILQGLTIYKSLVATATKLGAADFTDEDSEVLVGVRPAVLCLDPKDASKPGVLVVTHQTDAKGNTIITNEEGVKAGLKKQFGREVEIRYGCLPKGDYALNLIYGTGQAWTVPNEAGVCATGEAASADGKVCGKRARLASQSVVLTIGDPTDPAYCAENPTPEACITLDAK